MTILKNKDSIFCNKFNKFKKKVGVGYYLFIFDQFSQGWFSQI